MPAPVSTSTTLPASATSTEEQLRHENTKLKARIAGLEAEVSTLKAALDAEPIVLQRGHLAEILAGGSLERLGLGTNVTPPPSSELAVPIGGPARAPLPRVPVNVRDGVVTPAAPARSSSSSARGPRERRTIDKGGRPRNQALWDYVKAHYQTEGNDTIAKKFSVAENTVRRVMWEQGLKRDKQIRRPRGKGPTKKKGKR